METIADPVLITSLQLRRCEVMCADAICGRLAAGGGDGSLRLWRWSRGVGWLEFVKQKRAHRYGVTGTRFSASGVLLASIGIDGAARVWAAYEGLFERRTLVAPDATAARALKWATSERLVIGHDDGAVRIWSIREGTLLSYVRPHEGAVYALATPAFNALLLTACTDGVLKVFDFQEVMAHGKDGNLGPPPLLWEDGAHDLGALCAADCGRDAATGGHDGHIRIWRVLGAGHQRRIEADVILSGHTAAVTGLQWKRDLLTSASLDRTARLWTVSSAVCIRVLHAHSRYLTCIVLATDMRYIITGSNDKTLRTWSLGFFSVDDDLEADCNRLVHFGLGDLEGIGPVDDDDVEVTTDTVVCASMGTHCISRISHAAAINCIAASQTLVATASSDGSIRIFRWCGEDGSFALQLEMELCAHTYPASAVDFGVNGAILLSAGLDGCARLWDVQSGSELMVLSAENSAWRGDGGGGVRDARISPHRPPMMLLSSDDGFTALWGIEKTSPDPLQVYTGLVEAALCCAWSSDGGLAAVGGAAGELQVLAPPSPSTLCQQTDAHDLGKSAAEKATHKPALVLKYWVLSCDFAPNLNGNESESVKKMYILATGGRDALIKLWWVTVEVENDNIEQASLKLSRALAAHGGAVQCVRWAQFGRYNYELTLATGGADRWARVWRVSFTNGELEALAIRVVPAGAAGGAPAVRLLGNEDKSFLVVGALSGILALWRLPDDDLQRDIEGAEPRFWSINGVITWLYEYVTGPSEDTAKEDSDEKRLAEAARSSQMTGAQLLDDSLADILMIFGYEEASEKEDVENDITRKRLIDELLWLRKEPMEMEMEVQVPHEFLCPLSHVTLAEPVRAADGFTYDRQAFFDWCLAAGSEAVKSPMSGRLLRNTVTVPNRRLRERLREYCSCRQ